MISLNINGKQLQADVDSDTPLLWVLRDEFKLNGTKFGCGIGVCGACAVLIDGRPVNSCLYPAAAAVGQSIQTIEGLPDNNKLHKVQQAWIEVDVPQCGYCQSGQIINAVALLQNNKQPSDEQINVAMTGICRCGAYPEIREAVHLAAKKLAAGGSHED
ncbi:MAG: (2Fe-2S)-binding protein [Gammaproteobacteria bacterium]|nr:(2Fe-2S)-binding protein [Gammaproteobacteria bacterium]